MSVVLAMFLDAYRELNSKRLFWVTLAISAMVVVGYGSISFNATGTSLMFGLTHVESDFIKAGSPIAVTMYRGIFSSFIVSIWLAWAATILALISTTSIFPDFMAGGAIDIVLSKPISRIRLFILKYLASLLFVLLQVGIFCVGIFICLGARVGEWNWKIFAAIPLVTVFFSYLYAVNVLAAVITRSSITALLASLMFWFSLFGINSADVIMNRFMIRAQVEHDQAETSITSNRARLEGLQDKTDEQATLDRERIQSTIDDLQQTQQKVGSVRNKLGSWHGPIRLAQRILPKTDETISLLDRWLKNDSDIDMLDLMSGDFDGSGGPAERRGRDSRLERETAKRMQAEIDQRSEWYVLGSSLAFEALVLGLACFLFVRRDY